MYRPMILCLLATLLVCTSAIPKFRENFEDYEKEPDLWRFESAEYVRGNLDTNLDQEDVPTDGINHRNPFATHQKLQSVGWWWDSKGVHNLTVGYRTYQDSVLLEQTVLKPYGFLRVQEQDIRYPNNGTTPFVISFVQAYDTHKDQSDAGYARITSGGVGNRNITIHLESKRNHGLKYVVRIWGHRVY